MGTNVIGQKVNVGGTELYYEYMGESIDDPTIVFDSGFAWGLENWEPIRKEVSSFANMFMYDRANVGKSENSNKAKHSKQNIVNLRTLLQKLEIKPPYILVGHSFGGVNVRLYASTYPEEVIGVILLDSCHEDQNKKMVPLWNKELQEDYYNGFQYESSISEFEESLEQVRGVKTLGKLPLTVVTGGTQPHHTPEAWSYWMSFQKDLAKLSSKSKHIIVKDAGHAIHIDCPSIVSDLIREMVETVIK
ncbi:alpha/beta fold hydrolase [Bacillus salitolerans]|uniref:Alpha/beta fold hydrolase n=1 Tax=Bacillus salitolerans TaxID=1437434 RepID=A0ABW4LTZ1_9BACI